MSLQKMYEAAAQELFFENGNKFVLLVEMEDDIQQEWLARGKRVVDKAVATMEKAYIHDHGGFRPDCTRKCGWFQVVKKDV